jgi:hypothetical protein
MTSWSGKVEQFGAVVNFLGWRHNNKPGLVQSGFGLLARSTLPSGFLSSSWSGKDHLLSFSVPGRETGTDALRCSRMCCVKVVLMRHLTSKIPDVMDGYLAELGACRLGWAATLWTPDGHSITEQTGSHQLVQRLVKWKGSAAGVGWMVRSRHL